MTNSLAYANMYHAVAAILRRFDMELVDTVFERDVKWTRGIILRRNQARRAKE